MRASPWASAAGASRASRDRPSAVDGLRCRLPPVHRPPWAATAAARPTASAPPGRASASTEAAMGCPIRADMETVSSVNVFGLPIPSTRRPRRRGFLRQPDQAAHRLPPSDIESGPTKIGRIGLGKQSRRPADPRARGVHGLTARSCRGSARGKVDVIQWLLPAALAVRREPSATSRRRRCVRSRRARIGTAEETELSSNVGSVPTYLRCPCDDLDVLVVEAHRQGDQRHRHGPQRHTPLARSRDA